MIDIVVDSSVALKWLVREQDSELAIRLLSPAVRRLAPDLLLVEVANALWKNERLKRIDPAIARRGVAELPRFFTEFFSAHDLVADASSLARDLDHPVYDCLYIIAARRVDCMLVTADATLLRKLSNSPEKRRVVDLAQWQETAG